MNQISIDEALAGTDSTFQVRAAHSGIHWLSGIAREDGRVTIRRLADGVVTDLTPQASVRSRVMEYGGGAYDVAAGEGLDLVAYCDDVTRRVWVAEDGQHRALTQEQERFRFGGLHLVPEQRMLVAVREDHEAPVEPRTEIVALDLDADNAEGGRVLVTGADFYAGPRVHDGQLAWFQWMHPDMSWDSAQVWAGPLGRQDEARLVAGGAGVSAQHPLWNGSRLLWVSDETGYWEWYAQLEGHVTRSETGRDCAGPTWVLDSPAAAVVDDDLLATVEYANGSGRLALWQPSTGAITYPLPGTADIKSISALDANIYVVATWPERPETLLRLAPDGTVTELVAGAALPAAVTPTTRWATGEAGPIQSFFYAPPQQVRPPLLVMTHGGPTGATDAAYDRQVQFWVSRGFAVLDVNYSGSTGFGRAYRDRLTGRWGLLDVSDVIAAVAEVVDAGLADEDRIAITGGSAGGYTTLQALVNSDVFAAGMSSYGIADLRTLATDTHKAESRYLDSLVGPWPEAEQVYLDRSPLFQLDALSTPMLILQGLADKVVPPNQAFAMADAVRAKDMPLAVVTFAEEGHGFRALAARKEALEAKLSFLQQVFGLEHSSDIPRLENENLG